MTNIQVFNSPEFGEVRTTIYNGEIAFVAKDVAEKLGYEWKGSSGTLPHIPEEWKGVQSVQTPASIQKMILLTEQGLYFFLARSDKPLALPFQKWIAGEVIPKTDCLPYLNEPLPPDGEMATAPTAERGTLP